MTYIVQRKSRFYVVAYDRIDTLTGRGRRRWHPAGHSRADAEAIAANIDDAHTALNAAASADPLTVARYLTEQWLPVRANRFAALIATQRDHTGDAERQDHGGQPVDVYRIDRTNTQVNGSGRVQPVDRPGRRASSVDNEKGPETLSFRAF